MIKTKIESVKYSELKTDDTMPDIKIEDCIFDLEDYQCSSYINITNDAVNEELLEDYNMDQEHEDTFTHEALNETTVKGEDTNSDEYRHNIDLLRTEDVEEYQHLIDESAFGECIKNDLITDEDKVCLEQFLSSEVVKDEVVYDLDVDKQLLPAYKSFTEPTASSSSTHFFKCSICKTNFNSLINFKKHMLAHNMTNPNTETIFKCQFCTKEFLDSTALADHTTVHTNVKFKCEFCEKLFTKTANLDLHLKIHTGIKELACEICHKKFTHKPAFVAHLKSHKEYKPFNCPVCHKDFFSSTNLSDHLALHSNIKKFKCEYCGKLFIKNTYLNRHLKTHAYVKEYTCGICHKKFTHKPAYTSHLKVHNRKEYACKICDEKFLQKTTLNLHLKIHTPLKGFKCNICNNIFARQSALDLHSKLHTGIAEFKCNICDKSFSEIPALTSHLKIHSF